MGYEPSHHDAPALRPAVDASGVAGSVSFGGLSMASYTYGPCGTVRAPRCEQCADEGALRVIVNERGRELSEQGERQAELAEGHLIMTNIAASGRFHVDSGMRKHLLHIPRAHVAPLWPDRGALSTPSLMPAPAGSLLLSLLSALSGADPAEVAGARGDAAANAVLELLLHQLGPVGDEQQASREARWLMARDYIEDNLAEPGLTAAGVAAALGVSTRALYLLFQGRGDTVRGYIRRRRLERCHADLRREGSAATVADIASRWGFADQATFSRAFRGRYGRTPGSVRDGLAAARGP